MDQQQQPNPADDATGGEPDDTADLIDLDADDPTPTEVTTDDGSGSLVEPDPTAAPADPTRTLPAGITYGPGEAQL